MSNPFSPDNLDPILSNYPVRKGGSGSGRYPAGSGITASRWSSTGKKLSKLHDESHALAGRVRGLSTYAHAIGSRPMEEVEDKHVAIAYKHADISEELRDIAQSLSEKLPISHPVLDALEKASYAHHDAYRANMFAEPLKTSQDETIKLSAKAAQLTDKALSTLFNYTDDATGKPTL
jgi:hypothetical protein